jgi:hypothetical protein
MLIWRSLACVSVALLWSQTGSAHPAAYPATYEGGSLPLPHHKVKVLLGGEELLLLQGHRRIVVPVKQIREISCGTQVHRRPGATVLGAVPFMRLAESEEHYVGVTWTEDSRDTAVLFRLDGGEYREFVAALERLTGIKAIDTFRVPSSVRYSY